MRNILLFYSFLIIGGCSPAKKDALGFFIYIIEKGNQSSNGAQASQVNTTDFHFVAKFDSTAIYSTKDTINQLDINKLYGFTEDNLPNPHVNSARVGWRWYKNELQLFAYCYNNSILEPETIIKSVSLNEEIHCQIRLDSNTYYFNIDGTSVTMPRYSRSTKFSGFKLFPHFGGTENAPHRIQVKIKEI